MLQLILDFLCLCISFFKEKQRNLCEILFVEAKKVLLNIILKRKKKKKEKM